jgi:hypothetical protein
MCVRYGGRHGHLAAFGVEGDDVDARPVPSVAHPSTWVDQRLNYGTADGNELVMADDLINLRGR